MRIFFPEFRLAHSKHSWEKDCECHAKMCKWAWEMFDGDMISYITSTKAKQYEAAWSCREHVISTYIYTLLWWKGSHSDHTDTASVTFMAFLSCRSPAKKVLDVLWNDGPCLFDIITVTFQSKFYDAVTVKVAELWFEVLFRMEHWEKKWCQNGSKAVKWLQGWSRFGSTFF